MEYKEIEKFITQGKFIIINLTLSNKFQFINFGIPRIINIFNIQ